MLDLKCNINETYDFFLEFLKMTFIYRFTSEKLKKKKTRIKQNSNKIILYLPILNINDFSGPNFRDLSRAARIMCRSRRSPCNNNK